MREKLKQPKNLTQKENIQSVVLDLSPAFKTNNIPIVFSCDDNYLPYLAALLQSIKTQSSMKDNYDICVLYDELNEVSMQKLKKFITDDNFSLRFINISSFIKKAKQNVYFHTAAHFKESTYYRFFIPELFKAYKKLIYMDLDMIVLKDLKELFLKDFQTPLAAVKEYVGMLRVLNYFDPYYIDFIKNKNLIKSIRNYIQAGLLIYNIPECLNIDFTQKCLDKLAFLEHPPIVDQDVINSAFEGQITFLEPNWNYAWNLEVRYPNFSDLLPKNLAKEALQGFNHPYIIHYNDQFKPWTNPTLPKAEIWWKYARETPFYEEIFYKNLQNLNLENSSKNLGNEKANLAVLQIKNHLSYKLGSEILSIKKYPLKVLILPLSLPYIALKHKLATTLLKFLSSVNVSLKPLPLSAYLDYNEALKIKEHLSYKLGQTLIKHPLTFVFRVKGVYREWKKAKEGTSQ